MSIGCTGSRCIPRKTQRPSHYYVSRHIRTQNGVGRVSKNQDSENIVQILTSTRHLPLSPSFYFQFILYPSQPIDARSVVRCKQCKRDASSTTFARDTQYVCVRFSTATYWKWYVKCAALHRTIIPLSFWNTWCGRPRGRTFHLTRSLVALEGWSLVRDRTNRQHCPSHEIWSFKKDGRWWGWSFDRRSTVIHVEEIVLGALIILCSVKVKFP